MSSADSPRFDATAAAQQMLELEVQSTQPSLPAQQNTASVVTVHETTMPRGLLPAMLTDRGNAKLFAIMFGDQFRHVEGLGWYHWDQYRWKRTGGEKAAVWAAGDLAEQMPTNDPTGTFHDREINAHRRRSMSTPGIKALLTQAKASPALALDPDVLDGDPYALCTPAGVVNLHSGDLHKPDPEADMHSRATRVAPEAMPTPAGTASSMTPSARTPRARRPSTSCTCCSATPSPATSAPRSCPSSTAQAPTASPCCSTS